MPSNTQELVYSPSMLRATLGSGDSGRLLTVWKSPVVKTHGALFRPVREAIEGRCITEVVRETRGDPEMMFGKVELTITKVWDVCPAGLDHDCALVGKAVGWSSTDRLVS